LQYLQMRQLNSRNPAAAQANPQMQMMQRYMPLIFAVIYLRISAGVNIYFVVSSLCRIGIQEAIFRSGILQKTPKEGEEVRPARGGAPRRKTLMERLADAQQRALEQQRARQGQPELTAASDPKPSPRQPRPENRPTRAVDRGPRSVDQPGSDQQGASNGQGSPSKKPSSGGTPNGSGRTSGSATGKPRPSGGSGVTGNGAPAKRTQPQAQPRSAKKRPRRAR
jgi:uncharacterized membrane protein YgcG